MELVNGTEIPEYLAGCWKVCHCTGGLGKVGDRIVQYVRSVDNEGNVLGLLVM